MVTKLESVAIRRAGKQDLAGIENVRDEAIAAAGTTAAVPVDWASYVKSNHHFIYLAEDSRPFGVICAGAPVNPIRDENEGEIIGWYLVPAYWHHGMGRKLLVRGLSVLKRRHFEAAFMWLPGGESDHEERGARRAIAVAESVGFERIEASRTTNLPDGSLDEHAYRITLDSFF